MKSKILRITGSPASGFVARYFCDDKLIALGKGPSAASAAADADKMLQSLKLAQELWP